jgi:uncharacterized protein
MSEKSRDYQIDYIEFPAIDIKETQRFYADVFGWKFEDYGPEYTSFSNGRITGGFYKAGAARAPDALVVLYASDLAALVAKVQAAGGKITKETFAFPGGRRFHFADTNGNELAAWSDKQRSSELTCGVTLRCLAFVSTA